MDRKFYYFIACVFSISFLDLVVVSSQTKVELYGKNGQTPRVQLPLVTYGAKPSALDLWNIQEYGSMVGIVGGRITNITEHPYQIAIDHDKSFVCSGALLNRIWAITLATCADGASPSQLTVRSGSDSNIHGGTVYNVSDIKVHPQFNSTTRDYDFAMLKLNSVICTDKRTEYIDFTTKEPEEEYQSVISGWGSNKRLKKHQFRELNMTVVSHKKCVKMYTTTNDLVTDRMFCASAKTKGPCYNDFGDPLVINDTLYGLYSWSRGCGLPDYPPVFSNVAHVTDWIYTVMNDACICGPF